jgi:hypothetical protein
LERLLSRSTRFAIQLAVTTVGAVLDYLVGRLTNRPSLGILCWALLILVAAAVLDFFKDAVQEHRIRSSGPGWNTASNRVFTAAGIIRGRIDQFRWPTVVNAITVAVLAGIAGYVIALAVIIFRFLKVAGGPVLGAHSPYDQSAISLISSFQTSSTMAWFIVVCFAIALFLRPPVVLPLGVMAISVANSIVLAVPPLSPAAADPNSQLADSLSMPDAWLLDLPAKSVILGCVAAFVVGIMACGFISQRMNR